MRILIAAAGSRGDVAPYTGRGAELRRAGHDVALATGETPSRPWSAGQGWRSGGCPPTTGQAGAPAGAGAGVS